MNIDSRHPGVGYRANTAARSIGMQHSCREFKLGRIRDADAAQKGFATPSLAGSTLHPM